MHQIDPSSVEPQHLQLTMTNLHIGVASHVPAGLHARQGLNVQTNKTTQVLPKYAIGKCSSKALLLTMLRYRMTKHRLARLLAMARRISVRLSLNIYDLGPGQSEQPRLAEIWQSKVGTEQNIRAGEDAERCLL